MALPTITMRQMLEAGVHFGHRTRFWNPKMAPYIFGARNKIHIINLEKTLPHFQNTLEHVADLASKKAKILFVGTKRAAQDIIKEQAKRCGMPYVNHRWLGGMLTNYKTIRQTIKRYKQLERMSLDGSFERLTKKEALNHTRQMEKLELSIGGIKEMGGLPDALFIIDNGFEHIAVCEANKLKIPVISIVDTNNDPEGVDQIIPGNDDSVSAIYLYVSTIADAILEGKSRIVEEAPKEKAEKPKATSGKKPKTKTIKTVKKEEADQKPKKATAKKATAKKTDKPAKEAKSEETKAAKPKADSSKSAETK